MVRNLKELNDYGYLHQIQTADGNRLLKVAVGKYKFTFLLEPDTRLDYIVELINKLIDEEEGK